MHSTPSFDPDRLGGVAGPILTENRPKPTKTEIMIVPRGLTDTKTISNDFDHLMFGATGTARQVGSI